MGELGKLGRFRLGCFGFLFLSFFGGWKGGGMIEREIGIVDS